MSTTTDWKLPEPGMEATPWMRDPLHTPHALPVLCGDVWVRRMEEMFGMRGVVVNGFPYRSMAPGSGPTIALEQPPQSNPAEAWKQFQLPRARQSVFDVRDLDYEAMTADEIGTAFSGLVHTTTVGWAYTMAAIMAVEGRATELVVFCRDRLGSDGELAAATLMAGYDNETTATGERIGRLAELAQASPTLEKAVLDRDLDAAGKAPGGAAFLAAFEVYLGEYGLCNGSWSDFSDPSWQEDPAAPLQMIAGAIRNRDGSARLAHGRAGLRREETLRNTLAALTSDEDRATLQSLVEANRAYVPVVEERARWQLAQAAVVRIPLLALGRKLAATGALAADADVFHLHIEEIPRVASGEPIAPDVIERRKADLAAWRTLRAPMSLGATPPEAILSSIGMRLNFGSNLAPAAHEDGGVISGSGASRGTVRGIARVVLNVEDGHRLAEGEVLVCPFTAPSWTPLFSVAAAVVTDAGGVLSHAAIAAREYAVPCVVGTGEGTVRIPDGALVEVDGAAGTVTIVG
jgi:pyruvate,water dikinase